MDTALEEAKNGAIIGLDSDLKVYSGYDSYFAAEGATQEVPMYGGHEVAPLLSKEHREELADLMIARWTLYKNSLK